MISRSVRRKEIYCPVACTVPNNILTSDFTSYRSGKE